MENALSRLCSIRLLQAGVLSLLFAPITAVFSQVAQPIADAVENELAFDQAVPVNRIDVQAENGVVALEGTVSHLPARERAGRLAGTVKGVKEVDNRIRVVPESFVSDPQIRQQVETVLAQVTTAGPRITVSASDGQVTLSGALDSLRQKQRVVEAATGVEGVVSIDDKLTVEPSGTESEVVSQVRQGLRWNALLNGESIQAELRDGSVVLTGTVDSAAQKREAVRTASVKGVSEVDAANLQVAPRESEASKAPPGESDAEIKEAVEAALERDPGVDEMGVTVTVSDRVVTLRGQVESLEAQRAATEEARGIQGVWRVQNRIKVRPTGEAGDEAIVDLLREGLNRDPYLEPYQITAEVRNGTAYLSGNVDTYFEKLRADVLAGRTAGVQQVRNRLEVYQRHRPVVYDPLVDRYDPQDFPWYDYEPGYPSDSDAEIREDVRQALSWNPLLEGDPIEIEVNDGIVTLSGTVNARTERSAAIASAYQGGAEWVRDRLRRKGVAEGTSP